MDKETFKSNQNNQHFESLQEELDFLRQEVARREEELEKEPGKEEKEELIKEPVEEYRQTPSSEVLEEKAQISEKRKRV
ncbi:MAG: hypothetical protein ACQESA_02230 [Patescibacteria group bacterium]